MTLKHYTQSSVASIATATKSQRNNNNNNKNKSHRHEETNAEIPEKYWKIEEKCKQKPTGSLSQSVIHQANGKRIIVAHLVH